LPDFSNMRITIQGYTTTFGCLVIFSLPHFLKSAKNDSVIIKTKIHEVCYNFAFILKI